METATGNALMGREWKEDGRIVAATHLRGKCVKINISQELHLMTSNVLDSSEMLRLEVYH